jgi:hypothetical protein
MTGNQALIFCVLGSHLDIKAICISQFSVYTCVHLVIGTIGLLPVIGNTLDLCESRFRESKAEIIQS